MSKTLTLTLPDELADRVGSVAASRGATVEELTVTALTVLVDDAEPVLPALTFIGIGAGRADLGVRHDEIRRELLAGE